VAGSFWPGWQNLQSTSSPLEPTSGTHTPNQTHTPLYSTSNNQTSIWTYTPKISTHLDEKLNKKWVKPFFGRLKGVTCKYGFLGAWFLQQEPKPILPSTSPIFVFLASNGSS
jgi:hypothetical protein